MPLQRRVELVTKLGLADLLSAKEFCSIATGAHGKPRMQVRKVQVLLRLHYGGEEIRDCDHVGGH